MVNPIGPGPSSESNNGSPLKQTVFNRMEQLREQYRTVMMEFQNCHLKKNPYQHQLHEICIKMKNFLVDHKEEIFDTAKNLGWPAHSNQNDCYAGDYNQIMEALNNVIHETAKPQKGKTSSMPPLPEFTGQLDFLNEQFTQFTWLLGTSCPDFHT